MLIISHLDTSERSFFVESSRRFEDHLRLSLEVRAFASGASGSVLQDIAADDFVRLEAAYYF